jgi:hypothetical protein
MAEYSSFLSELLLEYDIYRKVCRTYIYIYVYTHIYTHTHTHIQIHIYIYTHTHIYIYNLRTLTAYSCVTGTQILKRILSILQKD